MYSTTTSCVPVEDATRWEILINRFFQELHMHCDHRCVSEL